MKIYLSVHVYIVKSIHIRIHNYIDPYSAEHPKRQIKNLKINIHNALGKK